MNGFSPEGSPDPCWPVGLTDPDPDPVSGAGELGCFKAFGVALGDGEMGVPFTTYWPMMAGLKPSAAAPPGAAVAAFRVRRTGPRRLAVSGAEPQATSRLTPAATTAPVPSSLRPARRQAVDVGGAPGGGRAIADLHVTVRRKHWQAVGTDYSIRNLLHLFSHKSIVEYGDRLRRGNGKPWALGATTGLLEGVWLSSLAFS